MDTHIKVVGWLWIAIAILGILIGIIVLVVVFMNIPGEQDSLLVSVGILLCCIVPGFIANILAGYGVLKHKNWARILVIILAIINLFGFPIGTALGVYTLIIMFNEETKALFSGQITPVYSDTSPADME